MVKVQLLACNRKYCLKAFTISARPKALLTLFRRDFFATLAVMFINDRFGSPVARMSAKALNLVSGGMEHSFERMRRCLMTLTV
mgnify:FL=1